MDNTLKYSPATQKHRITAISAFLKYASRREMGALGSFNAVAGVITPKAPKALTPYFTTEEMKIILHLPVCTKDSGLRDAALLCLMYDSGARAQEMCDILVGDITFGQMNTVRLRGKGSKMREVPISEDVSKIIRKYLNVRGKTVRENGSEPLFSSQRSEKMTTASVRYLVQKYIDKARVSAPDKFLLNGYSPHSFRHSKAIHMLKAGVPLIYIRNFLGHESVQTTEMYLKMNQESVAEILQKRNFTDFVPSFNGNTAHVKDEIPEFLKRIR